MTYVGYMAFVCVEFYGCSYVCLNVCPSCLCECNASVLVLSVCLFYLCLSCLYVCLCAGCVNL